MVAVGEVGDEREEEEGEEEEEEERGGERKRRRITQRREGREYDEDKGIGRSHLLQIPQ
jgi:hypothetical protein